MVRDGKVLRYDLLSAVEDGKFSPPFDVELLDVSPSGDRMLFRIAGNEDRIDVWTIDSGAHVAGFRPYQDHAAADGNIRWACFVDEEHILTQDVASNLTLWKLPECSAVYELVVTAPNVVSSGRVLLGGYASPVRSPSRKHVALFAGGKIHLVEGLTGRVVGRPWLGDDAVRRVWGLALDGNETSLACNFTSSDGWLVTWDLASGRLKDRFPARIIGHRVLWADERRVLVGGMRWQDSDAISNRFSLLDLDEGSVGWHYTLSLGIAADELYGGRNWYVVSENAISPGVLVSVKLPHDEAERAMAAAPAVMPILGDGTRCRVTATTRLIDKNTSREKAEALVQRTVSESLTAEGVESDPEAKVEMSATLDEVLIKQEAELFPFGSGKVKAVVDITQLVCRLELREGDEVIWEAKGAFTTPARLEEEVEANIGIAQQLKRAQWGQVLEWFKTTRPRVPLFAQEYFQGLGNSRLAATGVVAAAPAHATLRPVPPRGGRPIPTRGGRRGRR
jgi:hypothetical protein